jgi:prephenate dehydratase
MKVAIQGEAGSFHDAAAQQFFAHTSYSILPQTTFRAVFDSLASDAADAGVVAVENSLYGSIHETYDQLIRHNFAIHGEVQPCIHQQLITLPGVMLKDITEVVSHPAALDQCREFLEKTLPHVSVREHSDTAGAVADIALAQQRHEAAIASAHAATLHDMHILAENIEDESDNITRFIVIGRTSKEIPHANKASLILTTDHQPGALYKALGVFEQNRANLTKLESRPVRGQPFRYQFIIDVLANQATLITIIHELEQLGHSVTLLGHYRSAPVTLDIA